MIRLIAVLSLLSLIWAAPALADQSPFAAPDEAEVRAAAEKSAPAAASQAATSSGDSGGVISAAELASENALPPAPKVDIPKPRLIPPDEDETPRAASGGSYSGTLSSGGAASGGTVSSGSTSTQAPASGGYSSGGTGSGGYSGGAVAASGSPSVSAGPAPAGPGRALSLNGRTAFMEVADSPSLDISDQITLEAWINPASLSGGIHSIVSKSNNRANNSYLFPRFDNANQLVFYIRTRNWQILNVGAVVPAGQWHHVAATYDGGRMIIYVDGVMQKGPKSVQGLISQNDNPLVIGNQSGYREYYHGLIDEVRIWNRALPPEEIRANMNRVLSGTETGLAAYWRFDELDPSGRVADFSGNGNNGLLRSQAELVASTAPLSAGGGTMVASNQPPAQPQAVARPTGQVKLKRLKGFGDFTGRGEKAGPDGSPDVNLRLNISAPGQTITGLTIRKVANGQSLWDTLPGNGIWLVALSRKNKVQNSPSGLNLPLGSEPERFDLWLTDNHTLDRGKDRLELVVVFADGRELVLPVLMR